MKNSISWVVFSCLTVGMGQNIGAFDQQKLMQELYKAQAQVLVQPHLASKDANLSPILSQFPNIKAAISQIDASLLSKVEQLQESARDLAVALHQQNQIQLSKIKDTMVNFSNDLNKITNATVRSILEYTALAIEVIAIKALEDSQKQLTPAAADAEKDMRIIIDILNTLQVPSLEEAVADLKELEQELEKRAQTLENNWRVTYASLAKVLNSSVIQGKLAQTTSFTPSALKELNDAIVSAIFEGKTQLFEALTILKKNANPLITLLIDLQKAKVAGKPLEEIIARIPNTMPDTFKLEQLSKKQIRTAVDAIVIEPALPVSSQPATVNKLAAASTSPVKLPSKISQVSSSDMQHLSELLELLEAKDIQQAQEHLNLLMKKIQEGNNTFDKSILITYQGIAGVLNSSVVKKELAQITSFNQVAIKRVNDLLVNAIFELKKQLFEAQMLIKKHANPLIQKVIELQKAKAAGKTAQEIIALIPTEIPAAPSIEQLTREQVMQAVSAIKLEPYIQK
jgi:hypothetical protein